MSAWCARPARTRSRRWARPRAPETLAGAAGPRAASTCCRPASACSSRAAAGDGLGALNYNNNPALLLMLLLAGAAHDQPGRRAPATERPGVRRDRRRTGRRRHADCCVRLHARARIRPRAPRPARRLRRRCRGDPARSTTATARRNSRCPPRRRGWLDVPRLRISTTRPLGLVRAWAYVWPEQPLLVYPAPEPHGPPLPDGAGEAAQTRLHPRRRRRPPPARLPSRRSRRARSRGSLRRAATACWCASTNSRSAPTSCSTGTRSPASTTKRAFAGWRAGSMKPNAMAGVIACCLPGQPPLGPAHGAAHRHACLRALALLPHACADPPHATRIRARSAQPRWVLLAASPACCRCCCRCRDRSRSASRVAGVAVALGRVAAAIAGAGCACCWRWRWPASVLA